MIGAAAENLAAATVGEREDDLGELLYWLGSSELRR